MGCGAPKRVKMKIKSLCLCIVAMIFTSCGSCDGLGLTFHEVYEGAYIDLNTSFTELIKANTEILEDCTTVNYTKSPKSDLHEWIQDYDIEKYDVSYECDILSFTTEIYKMGGVFYTLTYGMVPCGKINVDFNGSSKNTIDWWWFNTKYLVEFNIIKTNLENHTFCVGLEKKLYGKEVNNCE